MEYTCNIRAIWLQYVYNKVISTDHSDLRETLWIDHSLKNLLHVNGPRYTKDQVGGLELWR